MLLLFAAALGAASPARAPDVEAWIVDAPVAQSDGAGEPAAADAPSPTEESAAPDDPVAPGAEETPADGDPPAAEHRPPEATVRAIASTRGEGRAEISARAGADGVAVWLGASEAAGTQATQRQELFAGIEAGPVRGEARVVPELAGLFRLAAEAGVHSETWGLVLGGRISSLGDTSLRAAGMRLEVEGQLAEDLHAGASAAVWVLSLGAPPAADPWTRYGMATLDWCQRWEAGVWASRDFGRVALTPSLSFSQPPQEGAYEARSSLAVEVDLGPARLRLDAGGARLFGPEAMWMMDVSAGVTMSLH